MDVNHQHLMVVFALFLLILPLYTPSLKTDANHDNFTGVIINEIMYNPDGKEPDGEWIEIYNENNYSVNIGGWYISDDKNFNNPGGEGSYRFPNNVTIDKHGYMVIANRGTSFISKYGFYPDYEIINSTTNVTTLIEISKGLTLSNSGDDIHIFDEKGKEVDKVWYGNGGDEGKSYAAIGVKEGHSLARFKNVNTNIPKNDFYDNSLPSPKQENIGKVSIKIDVYPNYLPKIEKDNRYSIPFAIKVKIFNISKNESYELAAYVTRNLTGVTSATQTWDGNEWRYSRYYSINAKTENEKWSGWISMRFCMDYKEYYEGLKNVGYAYIVVKYRSSYGLRDSTYITTHLLDMDNSTSNGVPGGFLSGVLEDNNLINKPILILNSTTGHVTGAYITENNSIDESYPKLSGFYKISSPVGSNYTITVLNGDKILYKRDKISIYNGKDKVEMHLDKNVLNLEKKKNFMINMAIKNSGNLYDKFKIFLNFYERNISVETKNDTFCLYPGEIYDIPFTVRINGDVTEKSYLNISLISNRGSYNSRSIKIIPTLSDVYIKWLKEKNNKITCISGEMLDFKSCIKHQGNKELRNLTVCFYMDKIGEPNLLKKIFYNYIENYPKYPSIKLDTSKLSPGEHNLVETVDCKDDHPYNNILSYRFTVEKRYLDEYERSIVITRIYYNTHPKLNDEFITIYNPTNQTVDISNWYITDQPNKRVDLENKILFPKCTYIDSNKSITITFNATTYMKETGTYPNFEYGINSSNIPDMDGIIHLGNDGDAVVLKTPLNQTIDAVIYGDYDYFIDGWHGKSIKNVGIGEILKRKTNGSVPVDTDTYSDWIQNRRYGIGQSDFGSHQFYVTGDFTTFVSPDCGLDAVTNELSKARYSVYANLYEFTNRIIEKILLKLLEKGVNISILVEGSPVSGMKEKEKDILNTLSKSGANVRVICGNREKGIYPRYGFDHAKYAIIDEKKVIIGSMNWDETGLPSDGLYGNREWGAIIEDKKLAKYFKDVFLFDWNINRSDVHLFMENVSSIEKFDIDNKCDNKLIHFYPHIFNTNATVIPVLSPDNSRQNLINLINSAKHTIYVEQLYIKINWDECLNPVVSSLINASKRGVKIKVIINNNSYYNNRVAEDTAMYLEKHGIDVYLPSTQEDAGIVNIHNKGVIVDNYSVLISSINWNEQSIDKNREIGIIVANKDIARYYADVFLYDMNLDSHTIYRNQPLSKEYKNTIFILFVLIAASFLIIKDWKRRL